MGAETVKRAEEDCEGRARDEVDGSEEGGRWNDHGIEQGDQGAAMVLMTMKLRRYSDDNGRAHLHKYPSLVSEGAIFWGGAADSGLPSSTQEPKKAALAGAQLLLQVCPP